MIQHRSCINNENILFLRRNDEVSSSTSSNSTTNKYLNIPLALIVDSFTTMDSNVQTKRSLLRFKASYAPNLTDTSHIYLGCLTSSHNTFENLRNLTSKMAAPKQYLYLLDIITNFLKSLSRLSQTEVNQDHMTEATCTIQVLNSRVFHFPETLKRLTLDTDTNNKNSIFNELHDLIGNVLILYFKMNATSIDQVVNFTSSNNEKQDSKIVYFARIIRNSHNHFLDPSIDIEHYSFDCYNVCGYILRTALNQLADDEVADFCRNALLGRIKVTHHQILTKLRKTEIYYNTIIPKILLYLSEELENYCDKYHNKNSDENQKKRRCCDQN